MQIFFIDQTNMGLKEKEDMVGTCPNLSATTQLGTTACTHKAITYCTTLEFGSRERKVMEQVLSPCATPIARQEVKQARMEVKAIKIKQF